MQLTLSNIEMHRHSPPPGGAFPPFDTMRLDHLPPPFSSDSCPPLHRFSTRMSTEWTFRLEISLQLSYLTGMATTFTDKFAATCYQHTFTWINR
mmetsp:Transcript_32317/g.55130  ORF Transcript_32317/g.55130 Transcript_32317/m.55130 type:complete len:94 (-) Transcript_32317:248-529(-)